MSSAETTHQRGLETGGVCLDCPLCGGAQDGMMCVLHASPETILRKVEVLSEDVKKLKGDKLDLLRQNVVSDTIFSFLETLLLMILIFCIL